MSLDARLRRYLDAIADIGGETWLFDIKTGNGRLSRDGPAAGRVRRRRLHRPARGPRRFRLPRVSRYGVIHVRPEGARLIEYHVDRGTFGAFLEARRLFAWQQGPGKSVIGDPVFGGEGSAAA